jgi:hypothetical protein
MMRKTRLPRNTIKRALQRLVEAGEVRCLISTKGERLGRVSREVAKQAEDGRGIYQLTGAWSPFRKAASVLFADALEGAYLQIWLLPCRSEAKGRQIVREMLQSAGLQPDAEISIHSRQREGAGSPQNYSEAEMDYSAGAMKILPEDKTRHSEPQPPQWDWTWREDRLDAIGTEFCTAFPRFDGQWVVQIRDPRLIPFFAKRARTRTNGRAVADYVWLRQFSFPCSDKIKARSIVRAALSTLPEYAQHETEAMTA